MRRTEKNWVIFKIIKTGPGILLYANLFDLKTSIFGALRMRVSAKKIFLSARKKLCIAMQEGEKSIFKIGILFSFRPFKKFLVLDSRHFQEPPTLRLCLIIALFPSIVVKEGEIICQFLSAAEEELLLKCNHRVFVCAQVVSYIVDWDKTK